MSKVCAICGKKPIRSIALKKLRGKYNPTAKRKQYPNLQWVRLPAAAAAKAGLPSGKRVKVCTKCIKQLHKLK